MNKIKVAVLGATGAVGQRFVQLLAGHPWFQVSALVGSERSAGQRYARACRWVLSEALPAEIGEMVVQPLQPTLDARLVFSALPSPVAREVEPQFAAAGYAVCSNASAFRMEPDVPLLIPEINPGHLAIVEKQRVARGWPGFVVTSPNCTTTGITFALKPLADAFGLRRVFAATMQAISGAGYPGVASLDIQGNVLPYIGGEEDKIEHEPRVLLGHVAAGHQVEADFVISAQANRVPVLDGHTACLSVELMEKPGLKDVVAALESFRGPAPVPDLPSAPERPVVVRREPDRPQPRRDREAGRGMAVSVGRVRPCPLLDFRLVSVVHNTLRGAAGGAILNAELLVVQSMLPGEN
jgi:aspartate-semialdehyde dehydrogenase